MREAKNLQQGALALLRESLEEIDLSNHMWLVKYLTAMNGGVKVDGWQTAASLLAEDPCLWGEVSQMAKRLVPVTPENDVSDIDTSAFFGKREVKEMTGKLGDDFSVAGFHYEAAPKRKLADQLFVGWGAVASDDATLEIATIASTGFDVVDGRTSDVAPSPHASALAEAKWIYNDLISDRRDKDGKPRRISGKPWYDLGEIPLVRIIVEAVNAQIASGKAAIDTIRDLNALVSKRSAANQDIWDSAETLGRKMTEAETAAYTANKQVMSAAKTTIWLLRTTKRGQPINIGRVDALRDKASESLQNNRHKMRLVLEMHGFNLDWLDRTALRFFSNEESDRHLSELEQGRTNRLSSWEEVEEEA